MDKIVIRFASSPQELLQGLDLYCKSFPGEYDKNLSTTRAKSTILSDDYHYSRAIVAIRNGQVIGFLRYCERRIRLGVTEFNLLGISDYCIDKSIMYEPLFGVRFLGSCMNMLRSLNFPLAIGSGRRIMESYYSRFGYIGASTYAKCYVEKIPSNYLKAHNTNCIAQHSELLIPTYENMRLESAKRDWGVIYRTSSQWRWILFQVSQLKIYEFYEIHNDNEIVGYFILSKSGIIDFGFCSNHFDICCSAMLGEIYRRHLNLGIDMVLPVSFDHPIISSFLGLHYRFEYRSIPDEGIMTVALNPKILIDTFGKVYGHIASLNQNNTDQDHLKSLANALFMGGTRPFYAGNLKLDSLPPTFYRMNELDAL